MPGAKTIRGGFDSHTFPPFSTVRRAVAGLLLLGLLIPVSSAIGAENPEHRVSPFSASMRSMVFPGWGQLSNGSEIKAVVIFSLQSYLLSRAFIIERRARWYDGQRNDPDSPWDSEFLEERYLELRDRRGDMVWWTAILGLYSVLDAYVDAHMVGFDDDVEAVERVTWRLGPAGTSEGGVGIALAARF